MGSSHQKILNSVYNLSCILYTEFIVIPVLFKVKHF